MKCLRMRLTDCKVEKKALSCLDMMMMMMMMMIVGGFFF